MTQGNNISQFNQRVDTELLEDFKKKLDERLIKRKDFIENFMRACIKSDKVLNLILSQNYAVLEIEAKTEEGIHDQGEGVSV